jgi:hypothetical protein
MLLTRAVENDRTTALERRRAELLEQRRELRAGGAPAARIAPVVEELDRVDAELRALVPPESADDEQLRWRDAVVVAAAAAVVAALSAGAAALAFGHGSRATAADDHFVQARLKSSLQGTSCSPTTAKAALAWTWTLQSPGHDGETATIRATGPGLAPIYHVPVTSDRVRLARTSPCEPVGTHWKVRLVQVGSTPARLARAH